MGYMKQKILNAVAECYVRQKAVDTAKAVRPDNIQGSQTKLFQYSHKTAIYPKIWKVT